MTLSDQKYQLRRQNESGYELSFDCPRCKGRIFIDCTLNRDVDWLPLLQITDDGITLQHVAFHSCGWRGFVRHSQLSG